jgi:hypothetical protein
LHSPQPRPLTSVTQTSSQPSLQQRGSAAHTHAVTASSTQLDPTCAEQQGPAGTSVVGAGASGGVPASLAIGGGSLDVSGVGGEDGTALGPSSAGVMLVSGNEGGLGLELSGMGGLGWAPPPAAPAFSVS